MNLFKNKQSFSVSVKDFVTWHYLAPIFTISEVLKFEFYWFFHFCFTQHLLYKTYGFHIVSFTDICKSYIGKAPTDLKWAFKTNFNFERSLQGARLIWNALKLFSMLFHPLFRVSSERPAFVVCWEPQLSLLLLSNTLKAQCWFTDIHRFWADGSVCFCLLQENDWLYIIGSINMTDRKLETIKTYDLILLYWYHITSEFGSYTWGANSYFSCLWSVESWIACRL